MTNKPMLSVERELRGAVEQALLAIKRIYQAGHDGIVSAGGSCDQPGVMFENDPTVRELRALLDKPAEIVIDLDALDWATVKEAAAESKWMPPEYMRNEWVSDVCEFLRSGPAAQQQQGEPVAIVRQSPVKKYVSVDLLRTDLKHGQLLYAEQPAPVAVVMPERRTPDGWQSLTSQDLGWNAALAEVARLNGVTS